MVCEESQIETLYAAADRVDGTGTTEFNTKGATTLYFIHDVRDVVDSADPPTGTVIQGTITNISNSTDDDLSTKATFSDSSGSTDPISEYDWGAAASRSITVVFDAGTTSGIWTWSYAIDPDGLGFDSFITFKTGSSLLAKTTLKLFDSQTVQKLRLKFVNTSGTSDLGKLYEVYDIKVEHGATTFSLEFNDQARSDWKNFTTFTEAAPFVVGSNVTKITTAGTLPHKTTGLLRLKYSNTGKNNFSMIVIKANPCKA